MIRSPNLHQSKSSSALQLSLRGFVHLANLTLAFAHHLEKTLGPFNCFTPRLHLDDGIASDQLLGFGKGSVGNCELSTGDPNAGAVGTRLESVGREKHAGLGYLLD